MISRLIAPLLPAFVAASTWATLQDTSTVFGVIPDNVTVVDGGQVASAAACQALALVLVGTFLDPIVKTWNPGVRTFVFLCFLMHIVYRIATSKRNDVTSS